MRKELVWAGVIGISFGLIIAFGAWRIQSSLKKESITTEKTPSPTLVPSEFKITLDKPENNDVVTEDSITVTGITKSLVWITVSGEKGDYIVQAGENGVFIQDVDLVSGINQIKVTAFDPKGNQSIQKVLVVFSSSFQLSQIPSPTPGNDSTESAIRQKVAEKVAEALNKPKAYIGVITDIADSTIQIKTMESEIKQISTGEDGISVVNQKGTNNKAVKLSDVAIGDFIVAMGYINSKSVLTAQRILIADPIEEPEIDLGFGTVTDTSKKSVIVTGIKSNEAVTVTPGVKTKIFAYDAGKTSTAKLASITEGDLIIYVSDSSEGSPIIRSLFVLPKI